MQNSGEFPLGFNRFTWSDAATLIRDTAAMLQNRDCWIKREPARSANGQSVSPLSPKASCWCLHAMLDRMVGLSGYPASAERAHSLAKAIVARAISRKRKDVLAGRTSYCSAIIIAFNDDPDTTHDDLLSVLVRAYAMASRIEQRLRRRAEIRSH